MSVVSTHACFEFYTLHDNGCTNDALSIAVPSVYSRRCRKISRSRQNNDLSSSQKKITRPKYICQAKNLLVYHLKLKLTFDSLRLFGLIWMKSREDEHLNFTRQRGYRFEVWWRFFLSQLLFHFTAKRKSERIIKLKSAYISQRYHRNDIVTPLYDHAV